MSSLPFFHPSIPFLGSLALLANVSASEIADYAGTWRFHAYDSPARLREVFLNTSTGSIRFGEDANAFAGVDEIVVNVFFPDPFSVSSGVFELDAGGALTGDLDGNLLQAANNRLTIRDFEVFTLHANVAGDLLKRSEGTRDQQGIALALKSPDSLTTADLAGSWKLVTFRTPDDITVIRDDERVVDTFFQGDFNAFDASLEIDASGNISGEFSGTTSITGTGAVTLSIDGADFPFSINASKNTMVSSFAQNDETEYVIMVKEAQMIAQSALKGTWRLTALEVPTNFRETYLNTTTETTREGGITDFALPGEQWVDLFHPGQFDMTRLVLQVDEAGNFSQYGGGSFTPHNGSQVNITLDGDTVPFYCNDDQTLLTAIVNGADEQMLIVAIRTGDEIPNTFDEAVGLQISPAKPGEPLVISWNGASNLILQALNVEESAWELIELPDGTDAIEIDPVESGPVGLFRVVELPVDGDD